MCGEGDRKANTKSHVCILRYLLRLAHTQTPMYDIEFISNLGSTINFDRSHLQVLLFHDRSTINSTTSFCLDLRKQTRRQLCNSMKALSNMLPSCIVHLSMTYRPRVVTNEPHANTASQQRGINVQRHYSFLSPRFSPLSLCSSPYLLQKLSHRQ